MFVKVLRVDYSFNQLVINYPHIGDCIGNSVGSPIAWAIENLMICSNEVFEISIESSGERTKFECDDEEMIKALNLKVEMPRSSDANRLHFGSIIPKDSQANFYPSKPI